MYQQAVRVLGWVRRRSRRRAVQRAAARFAESCARSGHAPGAILLLERLGDVVAASAIVALLRRRHPDVRFAWFGRERYRRIAMSVPGIEDYVAVDCYGELRDVAASLSGWRVFDFDLNGKSCACCGGSWQNLSGRPGPDVDDYYDHGPLAVAFAKAGNVAWEPSAPALVLPPPGAQGPALPARYVVVHSESEESARNWNEAGWRRLVADLLELTDLAIVHVGVRRASWLPKHERVVDLAATTDELGLVAVVAGCELFVGIDSSVAHIANAFSRPGLVLLGRYRRFARYLPYTGFYGDGGAMIVRHLTECPFLPPSVVLLALRSVLKRVAAGRRAGAGGPWDVRFHDLDDGSAADAARQDAALDTAIVLLAGGDPAPWLRAWPGDTRDFVVAFDPDRVPDGARFDDHGVRHVVHRTRPDPVPAAITAAPRYLRHRGAPVVLGAAPTGPTLRGIDEPTGSGSDGDCSWYWCDVRGRTPAEAAPELAAVAERIAADRGDALEHPPVNSVVTARTNAVKAGIDVIRRGANGALEHVSGWALLDSTRTPPAACCLAQPQGDGTHLVHHCAPFSRLERPDVARALDAPGALFAGFRIDVPSALRSRAVALELLVSDRAAGCWQRVPLP